MRLITFIATPRGMQLEYGFETLGPHAGTCFSGACIDRKSTLAPYVQSTVAEKWVG
jgi:hypothetical protein